MKYSGREEDKGPLGTARDAATAAGVRRILLALLLAALARGSAAQDFAEARLREGRDAYRAHRPVEARDPLRIAAFGLLDQPRQLCEALVYLALSEEAAGHHPEAQTVLEKLTDAERRFPACAEASLDNASRADFQSRFRRRPFAAPAQAAAVLPAPLPPAPTAKPFAAAPAPAPAAAAPASPPRVATPEPAPPAPPRDAVAGPDSITPARVRRSVPTIYPASARDARVGGTVILRVLVSETGKPLKVDVVRGQREDLNSAAVASVQQWLFEPARRDGKEIQSLQMIQIPFQP
ncbi:MAG: energy transducer TonB [Acidobacteriota bacterium]